MKGGVRGKYAQRFQEGSNLALLDPDVAQVFPTDQSVNEALRLLIKVVRSATPSAHAPQKPAAKRTS